MNNQENNREKNSASKLKEEFFKTGKLPQQLIESFQKQHYAVVGNNSAVEICRWTKKSLTDSGYCYKQQFYGIRSHLCCQMTPSVAWCDQQCIFCWRSLEYNLDKTMENTKYDDPKTIVEGCINAQRRLLSGFGGNPKTNLKKFKEAQEPMHFAISLTGEPTLYPKLPELIKELHSRNKTTFLVSNGQHPEVIRKLREENALPTQLYISLDAPNEQIYRLVNRPLNSNGWQRLLETLKLLNEIKDKTRTVIRITLVKNFNDKFPEQYAELIKLANPMFLEIKGYMWVGHSRKRLKLENMPRHEEVREFSEKVAKFLNWQIIDEKPTSRVVLLMEHELENRIMKFE